MNFLSLHLQFFTCNMQHFPHSRTVGVKHYNLHDIVKMSVEARKLPNINTYKRMLESITPNPQNGRTKCLYSNLVAIFTKWRKHLERGVILEVEWTRWSFKHNVWNIFYYKYYHLSHKIHIFRSKKWMALLICVQFHCIFQGKILTKSVGGCSSNIFSYSMC